MKVAWDLEWAVALRRRRLLVLNVAVPLALVAPVALAGAPAFHAAAVYTVLFVLFGAFGSAIPTVRDGESGLLGRLVVAGLPEAGLLAGRTAAASTLDLLQLLPSVAVVAWAGPDPRAAFSLVPALAVALVAANVLGVWVAAVARSVAETALFAAVSALLLLHLGGVFRPPAPGSAWESIEPLVPFRALHEAALGAAGGAPAPGAGLPLAALTTAVAVGATVAAAPRIVRLLVASSPDAEGLRGRPPSGAPATAPARR